MSEIKVDTLTGKTTANDITVTVGATATMSLEQGLAKAWCHFEGDAGTVSILDGLNHASITDLATGRYSVTYTNSFSSTHYAANVTGSTNRSGTVDSNTNATGGISYEFFHTTSTKADPSQAYVSIHGDLA